MGWNQQMEYSFYFTRQIGPAWSLTLVRVMRLQLRGGVARNMNKTHTHTYFNMRAPERERRKNKGANNRHIP